MLLGNKVAVIYGGGLWLGSHHHRYSDQHDVRHTGRLTGAVRRRHRTTHQGRAAHDKVGGAVVDYRCILDTERDEYALEVYTQIT